MILQYVCEERWRKMPHVLSVQASCDVVCYSRVRLKRGQICEDITFSTAMTVAERKSNIRLIKDTP